MEISPARKNGSGGADRFKNFEAGEIKHLRIERKKLFEGAGETITCIQYHTVPVDCR
jgi:hypothetical protein